MYFSYRVVYVTEKQLILTDSLSRNPKSTYDYSCDDLETETREYVRFVVSSLPTTESLLGKIRTCQENDFHCQKLKDFSLSGWPNRDELSDEFVHYYAFKDNISYSEEFVLYNSV